MPATMTNQITFLKEELRVQYAAHVRRWEHCTACPLSQFRSKVVFYRGYLPCNILFIGEAPGESEDALGYPFVGPTGQLLAELVDQACFEAGYEVAGSTPVHYASQVSKLKSPTYGITNIVSCLPLQPDPEELSSGSIRPPNKEEATACRKRLEEIYNLARPKTVVCLGQIAERYFLKIPLAQTPGHGGNSNLPKIHNLLHPAAILRMENPSLQNLSEKRWTIRMTEILKGVNREDT